MSTECKPFVRAYSLAWPLLSCPDTPSPRPSPGRGEGGGCPSVMPVGPPLSFPPVVSGNPVFCFFVPLFVWAGMGEDLDSRLKMSGMTERGLPTSGMTAGGLPTAGMAEGRLPMSGMTAGGLPMSGMTAGGLPTSGMTAGGLPTSGMTAGGLPMSGMAAGGLPTAGVTCVCQTRHRKFCRFAVISSCPRISAIIISVTRPGCNR